METGKRKEPEAELNPSWLLPGLGLPASSFSPPSLPLLPASRQTPVSSAGFSRARWAEAGSPFPRDGYLMPWSSPTTIFPGGRLRRAAGGPSGAGARMSGGSRTHTLHLGKTGGGERRLDPRQNAPCPRGLHMICQRRWQVGHHSCHPCQRHDKACWWLSTEPGRGQGSLGGEEKWVCSRRHLPIQCLFLFGPGSERELGAFSRDQLKLLVGSRSQSCQ